MLWAGENAVASAFDMRGTFNDIALTPAPGAVKSLRHPWRSASRSASLNAVGFPNLTIALHHFKFVSVIALLGAAIGLVLGRWCAGAVIDSYRAFFRFPAEEARLEPWIAAVAVSPRTLRWIDSNQRPALKLVHPSAPD